ncbi:hypothetical protein [Actinobaculum sp. 313]|uniref:hypothetical protein n=1 Tax=Actinobaculum sp. 313 TaxID=2495645 RepID=UPI000D5274BF|nr:hypothetical protein [Actinobaculum sp. 313]AWE41712.1 hypothetical protein DDD63_01840 [Actinobaculum sp. 313]
MMKNRRILQVLIWSAVLTLGFLLIFPTSYGLPPANGVREIPLTRVLPVFLGVLAGTCAAGRGSGMEDLAGPRAKRGRALVLAGVCVAQLICLACLIAVVNLLAIDGVIEARDALVFLAGTLFFQALCIISAYLFSGPVYWVIPMLAFFSQVAFPYQRFFEPNWWTVLLTINPVTVVTTAVLVVIAGALALFTHPGIVTRARMHAPVLV